MSPRLLESLTAVADYLMHVIDIDACLTFYRSIMRTLCRTDLRWSFEHTWSHVIDR